jgi:hypothetical protein
MINAMPSSSRTRTLTCGDATLVVLIGNDDAFLGIGAVSIRGVPVRSGRLPIFPLAQSFSAASELVAARLLGISEDAGSFRIRLEPSFAPMQTLPLRDHSFDPIHQTGDWGGAASAADGVLELVLSACTYGVDGIIGTGFTYQWEYHGRRPLWWILDRASWELGGDITGATAYSQSSCSDPVVHFNADTAWTTEGKLFWMAENPRLNSVMTHNLPRFASHGSFDFQHKDGVALAGIFSRVGLIRSVLCRDPQRAELRHFDKHIDDESTTFSTVPKHIVLFAGPRDVVAMQNLWTAIHQQVAARARGEFGIVEQPFEPQIGWNFWRDFTIDSYRRDLLPAAAALGVRRIFVDNLKKSAMTEEAPLKGVFTWNMCCPHEYDIAPRLGGELALRSLVQDAAKLGVRVVSWTNHMQGYSSPMNQKEREEGETGNYIVLEDARQKWGGAYLGCMSALDLSVPAVREQWVADHVRIRASTGLDCYLFDSFYNLGFTPITYRGCQPRTMWRSTLSAVRQLQQGGVDFHIESFGPFGRVQHGHPKSYDHTCAFICLGVGLGNDYTTVPSGHPLSTAQPDDAAAIYFALAHQALESIPLFKDDRRIDTIWGAAHRRALADYHRVLSQLTHRILQSDGGAVVWHDAARLTATIFVFMEHSVALSGVVRDVSADRVLPKATSYRLQPWTTYQVSGGTLPTDLRG